MYSRKSFNVNRKKILELFFVLFLLAKSFWLCMLQMTDCQSCNG
jgi:hypothetical protein